MANNDLYVIAGATGNAAVAPVGSTAPASATAVLAAPFVDLGRISSDGLTEANADTWQNFTPWGSLAPTKSSQTATSKTFQVTFWESNPNVLGLYFRNGAAITVTPGTPGTFSFQESASPAPDYRAMVFDILEGTNHFRIYAPKVQATSRGNIVYKNDTIIGYQLTFTAYPDSNNNLPLRLAALAAIPSS